MSNREFTPLPDIDPERDKIALGGLGFPVGFDDERILVNVPRVKQIGAIGGIGTISVVGVEGEATQYSPDIVGSDSVGGAFAGMRVFKDKRPVLNDVRIEEMGEGTVGDMVLARPQVTVQINTEERDRVLKEKYKHGQLDAKGQAKLLNTVVSQGLSDGARLRFMHGTSHLEKAYSACMYGLWPTICHEFLDASPQSAIIALAGAELSMQALLAKRKSPETALRESYLSPTLGLERMFLAQGLAKASRFIKAVQ